MRCYETALRWSLCGTAKNFHHAVGGSATSVPELFLVLQEWTAAVLPKLYAKLHPDSDPSNPALHSQFVQLNEAYRVLSKDLSRKEYDFKIRQPYGGAQVFRSASTDPSYRGSMDAYENIRYWEQVHHPHTPEMMAEEKQKRRKRNFRLVAYCVVAMMLSIGAHAVLFKKLEEVHTNFMDEKDRIIIEIYNEAKERARVNGFKKQTEILRQKHAEFKEKYKRTDVGDDK
ncbi:dnaJ homolog subfamily C member 4 isoform X3 [Maylandia zebra]|uniref:dnaJ homolog subfamily C member 4 isoform X3 n=1 Tax=Maylandia zebra TaxID=106582 RepID=UPI00403D31EE